MGQVEHTKLELTEVLVFIRADVMAKMASIQYDQFARSDSFQITENPKIEKWFRILEWQTRILRS